MNIAVPSPLARARAFSPDATSLPLPSDRLFKAATLLLPDLERGRRIDTLALRAAAEAAFGASDAGGAWNWKDAYDACEAATVLFIRKFGPELRAKAPAARLPALSKLVSLFPTHTRRSEEAQARQQFSTPVPLGFVASAAAMIGPGDLVLEPSAGTGLLAILAELLGGALLLNELSERRAALLDRLFPNSVVTRFDAAAIDSHLDSKLSPSVVLMNPPFSALANVDRRISGAAFRHIASALARLREGGRLVAITGASFSPDNPSWSDAFASLGESGDVVFSAAIDRSVYARHGVAIETRLLVIDKRNAGADPITASSTPRVGRNPATLLAWVTSEVPPRRPLAIALTGNARAFAERPSPRRGGQRGKPYAPPARLLPPLAATSMPDVVELAYDLVADAVAKPTGLTDALYERYSLQSLRIHGAAAHPTALVQSAAMSSVATPKPSYRPHLLATIVPDGLLSDAQLESVIFAGEAHAAYLAGSWTVDETFDVVSAAPEDAAGVVRFRRGWFLGDGTGAGKGRQVAGILLDNWLKGRRRALWISKSDKLIEDAQRDWSALGMERLLVTPLSRFRQGTPIRLAEGILFTTYATLRSEERGEKLSRVRQIIDWLGPDFDGAVIFDESHAMQNAAGVKSERGDRSASQQGRAGLRLQHALPNARVVYVSATGATDVHNLAYAQRLGLWGGEDFPFATRADFVEAIEAGGVAAMEVLARDLKALGLYSARSLSYEGVEYELLEHRLSPEQIRIYDAYAGAFAVIHNNLDAAMEAANISGTSGTLNAQAKSAARSAFESAKQHFFNHLITAMKTPSLISSIENDLALGHAAVIQIVSTGESLMERRLAEIPTEDWNDVQVDITPREYVLDYLAQSFPVQLYEPYTDSEGQMCSRPVFRDGQPVECRDAVLRRGRLIENLASLAPVPGALDQIVQRFGTDKVAEITGRSRRIVKAKDRFQVENRAGSANLAEAQSFMDDQKSILVFSEAGGTGRSYHAELSAKNRRLRVHYLLEPGWKADAAIQGLGRTNRTNQAQPPLFRPIATDVKAEKRFLSTIARRLDTLGAITRGQRQTGGQGLFRPEDNLESAYARDSLRQLYHLLAAGKVEDCSLRQFEEATGLKLRDETGLKDELPPITTFLNRLLALTIRLQNILFAAFEQLLNARIEGAVASGAYDVGLETLRAESFVVTDRRTIHVHAETGAQTELLTIQRRECNRPLPLDEALERLGTKNAALLVNERSGRAAVRIPSASVVLDDGDVERRVKIIRPMDTLNVPVKTMAQSHWFETTQETFSAAWSRELADIEEFTESTIHVVAGLLLPIWKRLPKDSTRVFRLQTDAGERIIGRRVSAAWAAGAFGADRPTLTGAQAFAALLEGRTQVDLDEGMQLRRARVMGTNRIELSGFAEAQRDRLRADGLFSEIISWKLRLFVPTDETGPDILQRVLDRFPVVGVHERDA